MNVYTYMHVHVMSGNDLTGLAVQWIIAIHVLGVATFHIVI